MRHVIACAIALIGSICATPIAPAAPRAPAQSGCAAPTPSAAALPAPAPSTGSTSAAVPVGVRVVGGGEHNRSMRTLLRVQIADDRRLALDEAPGDGLWLDVRLDSSLTRHLGRSVLRCSAQQSIVERASNALRASATQRGTVLLAPNVGAAELERARTLCFEAISPAVVEGLQDYVVRTAR